MIVGNELPATLEYGILNLQRTTFCNNLADAPLVYIMHLM